MQNKRFDPRPTVSRALKQNALVTMLVLSLTLPLLQGCAAAVVTSVAVGASVAHERRSAGTVLDDETIELQAMNLLNENPDIGQHSRIAITSYNYVVLLTGQAETQELSDRFADMVSRLPEVRRVVNEVSIGPSESLSRESQDVLVTSQVKLALAKVDIPGFDLTRVKVVTEAGTVFLMGLLTHEEADNHLRADTAHRQSSQGIQSCGH
ncbi:MAG: BON domain-containing protein [Pseudomonadota bacterium]|nr:BON domain-containing protein [Pseudomonadota bacterium]